MNRRFLTWFEQLRDGKPDPLPDAIDVNLSASHTEFIRFVDQAMAPSPVTDALKHHVRTINGDYHGQ